MDISCPQLANFNTTSDYGSRDSSFDEVHVEGFCHFLCNLEESCLPLVYFQRLTGIILISLNELDRLI